MNNDPTISGFIAGILSTVVTGFFYALGAWLFIRIMGIEL
jgi:hypothetical protein